MSAAVVILAGVAAAATTLLIDHVPSGAHRISLTNANAARGGDG